MFNKLPINEVRQDGTKLADGYEETLRLLQETLETRNVDEFIVIDGTHGADFEGFSVMLDSWLRHLGYDTRLVPVRQYVKSEAQLRERFANDITDNRAFGVMTKGEISDYFRMDAVTQLENELVKAPASLSFADFDSNRKSMTLVVGTGSHWLTGGGTLNLFLDVSRETQQALHASNLCNFGFDNNEDTLEKYKIAFFVEWPILEAYRKEKLGQFQLYVDMNKQDHPTSVAVDELLLLIRGLAAGPMRVKPFFAPGVWGGQYLKELADLPSEWDNCAWGFEPIAPENSILIGNGGKVIDVPFLLVMNVGYEIILGDRISGLFGDYFPIRFDYLDTMGGTNLSVQVHPKQTYMREKFNYILEQQESYYMMEKKEGSKVYLGLTEECTENKLLGAVKGAQLTGVPIDHREYVQEWECEKGDLFLIPTGTVHCSGADNLVLEISSTTWWFTFKIYDYVRKGLDGKLRPINIDHAFANIDWYKKPNWVKEQLIQAPVLAGSQRGAEEYVIGRREDLLFYVNRIHLTELWEDDTQGEFLMLNLVEGERVRIQSLSDSDLSVELGYAESYILPAVLGAFRIQNLGQRPAKLIKAGVSSDWNIKVVHD
ncbi:class I mannose-6-phosphate isomerase [Paenibacillus agaridevorans]|uniref:class I mannose-6-phosphate isomerase n=1 Tax=Paenibacillus agaridevorans TaxID=171404 RepID=UPI001BE43B0E|nr:class I mannose-6-phosphate isomerase [Paenibacillus agaridevorans]